MEEYVVYSFHTSLTLLERCPDLSFSVKIESPRGHEVRIQIVRDGDISADHLVRGV